MNNARNALKKTSITKIVIIILAFILIISINQANKYKIILDYQKGVQTGEIQEKIVEKGNKVELQPGEYKIDGSVGNLTEGTYNIYAKEGYGLLIGDIEQGYILETIGTRSTGITKGISRTYERLCLVNGDEIEIKGDCVLVFEPVE